MISRRAPQDGAERRGPETQRESTPGWGVEASEGRPVLEEVGGVHWETGRDSGRRGFGDRETSKGQKEAGMGHGGQVETRIGEQRTRWREGYEETKEGEPIDQK